MDAKYEPNLATGSFLEDDVFLVPFDKSGNPTSPTDRMVWNLSEGKRVRLTGGPYEGDVGTIMGKSAHGDYRIRFVDSINPMFKVKRRPFSLWMGNWWLEQATNGLGICPGGKLPFVNVEESPQEVPKHELVPSPSTKPACVPTSVLRPKRPACAPTPPPLPPRQKP